MLETTSFLMGDEPDKNLQSYSATRSQAFYPPCGKLEIHYGCRTSKPAPQGFRPTYLVDRSKIDPNPQHKTVFVFLYRYK